MKIVHSKIFLGIAGSMSLLSCSPQAEKYNPPNIIVILADDMGYSDVGCFGSEISTPNIDSLASEGIIFTRFTNEGRCCPSRASLLTGLYPHQAGMAAMADVHYNTHEYQGFLSDQAVTIAELLKLKGYSTYFSGKWHVGDKDPHIPSKRGFDRSFAFLNGASSYYNIMPYRDSSWITITGSIGLKMLYDGEDYLPPAEGYYSTDAYTEKAIDFINADRDNGNPFFLYLAYTAPHWPLHAPEENIIKYEGRYDVGWDVIRKKRFENQKNLGIVPEDAELAPLLSGVKSWDSLDQERKERYSRKMTVFAAMIDRLDWNIGRLVKRLRESGNLDNTMIIFLSDNGGDSTDEIGHTSHYNKSGKIGSPQSFTGYGPGWATVSNTPFRERKATMFFGGTATPFIIRFPGMISPGSSSTFQGNIIDIMPTILELAHIRYPGEYNGHAIPSLPGESLLPVLTGEKSERENPLYFEHFGSRAMIEGDWKIVSLAKNPWELHHIRPDLTEMEDSSVNYPERFMYMSGMFQQWADSIGIIPADELNSHKLDPVNTQK